MRQWRFGRFTIRFVNIPVQDGFRLFRRVGEWRIIGGKNHRIALRYQRYFADFEKR